MSTRDIERPQWSSNLEFLMTRGPKGPIKRRELAEAVAVSLPTLSDWLNGEITELKALNLDRICTFFEIDSNAFLNSDFSSVGTRESEQSAGSNWATNALKNRVIPVTGCVFGVQNSPVRDETADSAKKKMLLYPARNPSAYAIQVETDDYRPRYKRRELLIVDPKALVEPGDEVLAKFQDGRIVPLVFNWRKGGIVQFVDINESGRPFTAQDSEILEFPRIIGLAQPDMLLLD